MAHGPLVSFTCQDLSGAFGRVLTAKMAPQCRTFTRALHQEKLKSLLFAMITNDRCLISSIYICM